MLSFDLQLAILQSLLKTYIDDRRIEINSQQFTSDNDVFLVNIIYLKKEKLIDVSSLHGKSSTSAPISSDEPETIKKPENEAFTLARCNLTHLGMKAVSAISQIKLIQA